MLSRDNSACCSAVKPLSLTASAAELCSELSTDGTGDTFPSSLGDVSGFSSSSEISGLSDI